MRQSFLIVWLVLIAITSMAMPSDTTKIHLRQSFENSDQESKPAKLLLSLPSSGRADWLVDAGVSLNIGNSSKIVTEFHRNTLIEKEQYNWQAGYNFTYVTPNFWGNMLLYTTTNFKYVRDVKDEVHSGVATVDVAFYKADGLSFGRPGYMNDSTQTYQIDISVEPQLQRYFGGDEKSGILIRPVLNLGASLAWNRERKPYKTPEKEFELTVKYINRYAVVNETANAERYSKLLRAGANYYVLNNKSTSVSLGISYNLGSDPLNGLKTQDFWQLAFQIQL